MTNSSIDPGKPLPVINRGHIACDLAIYLGILFLVRSTYFPAIGLIGTVVIGSLIACIVATIMMRRRGTTWKDLGLRKPNSMAKTLLASTAIVAACVLPLIAFEIVKDQLPPSGSGVRSVQATSPEQDNTSLVDSEAAKTASPEKRAPRSKPVSKFGDLKGNWWLFFLILPFIWLESALEELIDRGFLLTWLEKLFSQTPWRTLFAISIQAILFGYRHTYDFSERSVVVALFGFILGVAYVNFGRNLWPLIIAHCAINTMSVVERVV